ncbi:MAG TPA: cytochrome c oxidase subunit 3 [Kofleriaceae bacterium]|jgi:cytochrome c oxidase subunit 3|nr:cytochrome c oxidase subunit 3 [Kofleriaceae bacterium]
MSDERRYRLAIWIVIASETLLFAGLFALYASYRAEYGHAFSEGVRDDLQWIGGTNTLVLLTSSFAIAWAVHAMRAGRARTARRCLELVIVLGLAFLALKLVEWGVHVHDGVVPGVAYSGPDHGPGTSLFFTLYFAMTGLHALHVVAGLALVTWVRVSQRPLALELVALYWHFVDAIWVFLWPMFYLMSSS